MVCPAFAGQSLESRLAAQRSVVRAVRARGMAEPMDQAKASYDQGRVALEGGNHEEAIRSLSESARLHPHFKTLELLGESLLAIGRTSESVVQFAAATTLNRQGRAPSLLAKALLAMGDGVKAHEMARLALERAPGNKLAGEVLDATKAEYDREQDRH